MFVGTGMIIRLRNFQIDIMNLRWTIKNYLRRPTLRLRLFCCAIERKTIATATGQMTENENQYGEMSSKGHQAGYFRVLTIYKWIVFGLCFVSRSFMHQNKVNQDMMKQSNQQGQKGEKEPTEQAFCLT